MEEAESSSASVSAVAVVWLALVALVMVSVLAFLMRRRWCRPVAQRDEVWRLTRLADEEVELAERESVLAYYSELFPVVVHAAEVPEAPVWGATPASAVGAAGGDVSGRRDPPAVGVGGAAPRRRRRRCGRFVGMGVWRTAGLMSSDVGPPKDQDWGGEREDDMAWWDPRVGKENRKTT
jgi:ubiquitin carboxyl-terminal hydrolase 36/42